MPFKDKEAHKEQIAIIAHRGYIKRKKECRLQTNEYRNQERHKIYLRLKIEIFELLGNKCSNPECPILPEKIDLRCLHIDHVHGGGCKIKRSKYSRGGGNTYYKKILQEIKNGSKDYQLLCVYCNWLKRYLNKEIKIL
jgi:hypothetical protein